GGYRVESQRIATRLTTCDERRQPRRQPSSNANATLLARAARTLRRERPRMPRATAAGAKGRGGACGPWRDGWTRQVAENYSDPGAARRGSRHRQDVGSAIDFTYKLPFTFTGVIEKVTIALK